MTTYLAPELKQKLTLLKTQKNRVQRRYLYRFLLVSLFAGGLLSVAPSDHWQIKDRSQIIINGDRLIEPAIIFNNLKIPYPQSVFTIPSQRVARQLKSIPALQSVQVTKTITPPVVKINLQERVPVATVLSSGQVGFLDSQGVWLEPSLYNQQRAELPSTRIKVVNFKPQYKNIWTEIYRLITTYPTLDIKEIHWDDRGNLFLMTSNFKVVLGMDYSLLKQQFATLASFPNLATDKDLQTIAQIDLTNPDTPFLEQHSVN